MRFVTLGVGDAFSRVHYSSSLAVEHEGFWMLVDCPHPLRKIMKESGDAAGVPLDVDRIGGVVLTHLHADHCAGLEDLAYYSFFTVGRKVELYAHPKVLARVWENHLAAGMDQTLAAIDQPPVRRTMDDYFRVHPLSETEEVRAGPFLVTCRPTIHHIFTTAVRLRAGGRSLGCSADTAFDPTLIEWLARSDVIVHETNVGLHTPYEKLLGLPEAVRRKIRLIHYPDAFDANASAIEPLREGRLYAV